jgi:hypothetical protein
MKENFADITTLHVKDFVYGPSTSTTSITFVANITGLTTSSTQITFTKQTAYISRGVIVNFSTVTTTSILAST